MSTHRTRAVFFLLGLSVLISGGIALARHTPATLAPAASASAYASESSPRAILVPSPRQQALASPEYEDDPVTFEEEQIEIVTQFASFAEAGEYYAAAAAAITQEIADRVGAAIVSPPTAAPGGASCPQTGDVTTGSVGAFGHALERLPSDRWEEATRIVARRAAELGYRHYAEFTDGAGNPHVIIHHESGAGYVAWSQAETAVLSISSPCLTVDRLPTRY